MANSLKLIHALSLVLLFGSSCLQAAQEVEIHTYDVLPPYAFRDDQGQLTGVYIEIVTTAISRMPDYTPVFKVFPWARAKYNTMQGTAFAILPPYFHAHDWLTDSEPKRPYIWPYSLPLYTQKDVVICNSKILTTTRKRFPEDYAGLSFVMWRGDGRANQAFNQMVKEKKIKVSQVNSIKDVISVMHQGRHNCTITAKLPFHWYITQFQQTPEYKDAKDKVTLEQVSVVSTNEAYLGYTDINSEENFPYKKDFAIKFDIEIYKMKQSGELDEIVNRFVNQNMNE